MSQFIKDILNVPNWTPTDAIAFHLLPDVPYQYGVYEVSSREFARMMKISYPTVGKFFKKLTASGLVQVLRETTSGRYSSIAFMRKDTGLHNTNYLLKDSDRLPSPGSKSILYPLHTAQIVIPKDFFKAPLKATLFPELNSLLKRDDLKFQSVHSILLDYVITTHKRIEHRERKIISIA